jgi:type II secretion system protein H
LPGDNHRYTLPRLPEKYLFKQKAIALNSHKGFSLTELLVVIAIVGIMTMIAVPAFNHYSVNANLKTAGRDIVSDVLETREKAIAENVQYMIQFSVSSNQYTLYKGTYSGSPWTSIQVKSPSAAGSDVRLTSAAFVSGPTASRIYFQTRGLASAGTVTLTNRYGSTATITLNSAGRAYVQFSMQ